MQWWIPSSKAIGRSGFRRASKVSGSSQRRSSRFAAPYSIKIEEPASTVCREGPVGRGDPSQEAQRRLEAEHLLHGGGDSLSVGVQPSELVGMTTGLEERVRDQ